MARKNQNLSKLFTSETFADMVRNKLMKKIEEHQLANPQQELYMMAWGDTTQPLPAKVVEAIANAKLRSI